MLKILATCILLMVSPAFAKESPEWIGGLSAADDAEQLVIVSGTHGSNARFSMHEKDEDGTWHEIVSCAAYIGKKGFGKTREGDMKTPVGVYTFTKAFGILPDPGCRMPYTQVDDSHYWAADSNFPKYYNMFVSTREQEDFEVTSESEHIIDYDLAYKYCLNISWNTERTPGRGSAIFLHCQTKNKFTAGCVAIPEDKMREVMRHVKDGCVVIMDTSKNIQDY